MSQALVAYTYTPGYSGDKDQEDRSSKQPRQIVRETLSRIKPITKKKGWWSVSRC
jgi:hypothetical protein